MDEHNEEPMHHVQRQEQTKSVNNTPLPTASSAQRKDCLCTTEHRLQCESALRVLHLLTICLAPIFLFCKTANKPFDREAAAWHLLGYNCVPSINTIVTRPDCSLHNFPLFLFLFLHPFFSVAHSGVLGASLILAFLRSLPAKSESCSFTISFGRPLSLFALPGRRVLAGCGSMDGVGVGQGCGPMGIGDVGPSLAHVGPQWVDAQP